MLPSANPFLHTRQQLLATEYPSLFLQSIPCSLKFLEVSIILNNKNTKTPDPRNYILFPTRKKRKNERERGERGRVKGWRKEEKGRKRKEETGKTIMEMIGLGQSEDKLKLDIVMSKGKGNA